MANHFKNYIEYTKNASFELDDVIIHFATNDGFDFFSYDTETGKGVGFVTLKGPAYDAVEKFSQKYPKEKLIYEYYGEMGPWKYIYEVQGGDFISENKKDISWMY